MTLAPWARRARARLLAMAAELEEPDCDLAGVCVIGIHLDEDGDLCSSCSASLGPICSANDMAAALVVESEKAAQGVGVSLVDREFAQ